MAKLHYLIALSSILVACTHANITTIPTILDGKEVYTYRGRANFGHQLELADKMMVEHCADLNQGRPVIVSRDTEDLGYVVSASPSNLSAFGNQNQIIYFSCEK